VPGADRASRAIPAATLETVVAAGVKTVDLGGHAGTTEFADAVVDRVGPKLEARDAPGG